LYLSFGQMLNTPRLMFSRLVAFLFLALMLGGCRTMIGHTSTGGVYRVESLSGRLNLTGDLSPESRTQVQWEAERELSGKGGTNIYYVNTSPPPVTPASPRDVPPTEETLRPFDPVTARAAFNQVPPTDCKIGSAPYGHAKVVLNPDGNVSKVIVDAPDALSAEAVKCIGERLGSTKVKPFKGSMVTMGTTFALR